MHPREIPDAVFIRQYKNLVHKVCQYYTPMLDSIKHTTGADYDDLYQIGLMGLLKARDRFNPDFGLKLSTYAVHMIIGEIRRFLRDNNMVKIPRWVKETHGRMRKLGLMDESAETVAAALGIPVSKAEVIIKYQASHRSLSEVVFMGEGEDVTLEETLSVEGFEDSVVNESVLQEFLSTLSEKEKTLWFAYYHDGLRQVILAEKFGISQVQVSRMLSKIEEKAVRFGKVKGYAIK